MERKEKEMVEFKAIAAEENDERELLDLLNKGDFESDTFSGFPTDDF